MLTSRKASRAIVALGLAAAGLLVNASAAHAADMNDPYVAGCTSGAYPVTNTNNPSGSTPLGYLHLMYSPHCNTNWVEADGTAATELEIYVWNAYGQHQQYVFYGSVSYAWSDMVSGVPDAGACISDAVNVYCEKQPNAGNPPTSPAL